MPPETDSTNIDHAELSEEQLIEQRMLTGLGLDGLCLGGRWLGTSTVPLETEIHSDIETLLNITGTVLPTGSDSRTRRNELNNPSRIPIESFNPSTSRTFFERAIEYAKKHADDTSPRLFTQLHADDLDTFLQYRNAVIKKKEKADPTIREKITLPAFLNVKSQKDITPDLFGRIHRGDAQGLIFDHQNQVNKASTAWHEFRESQEYASLIARPFFGFQGNTKKIRELADSGVEVDTIMFTDTPSITDARKIHEAHIRAMNSRNVPKKLENPFNDPEIPSAIRIAVVNVQGGARQDAIALLEASRAVTDFNVDVFLVENAKQLKEVRANGLLLGGGWHAIQYRLQNALGMNELIQELIDTKAHILSLCAGLIQTRSAHNPTSGIRSNGVTDGTTFGLGEGRYFVNNNVLCGPRNVMLAMHRDGDLNAPTAYPLLSMPFSNAPIVNWYDEKTIEPVAKLRTNPDAKHLSEETGPVVGIQVKNEKPGEPAQMAFSFHDKMACLLFLHEISVYLEKIRHENWLTDVRGEFKQVELAMAGIRTV